MTRRPKITETVYLRTGEDRGAKLITAKTTRQRSILYELTGGLTSSWHQDFEFQYEKPNSKFPKITGLQK